jgi:hypothetical protein
MAEFDRAAAILERMRPPNAAAGVSTDRAREVYERFTESVFEAARGPLDLYIDMHQNSSERNIEWRR